jgi:hypothetical protein
LVLVLVLVLLVLLHDMVMVTDKIGVIAPHHVAFIIRSPGH